MANIPAISAISQESSLAGVLSALFEPSPILISTLVPQLAKTLTNASPLTSYSELIDVALTAVRSWDISSQSQFITGHPRIGESKNLSTLSAKEQGVISRGAAPTPPVVLDRLAHLNACYEAKYPGLRYITFVNGRSRHAIAEEMEDLLGFEHSLSPSEPALEEITCVDVTDEKWRAELQRAIRDVGRIANNRLEALGIE